LASRPFVVARDFGTETLLAYSPKEESTFYQRYLVPAGVAPARFQQMQLTEAVIELVKAGLGVSVLARWAVAPALAAGTIRGVPVRPAYRRTWSAATLKDVARVPHVREFVEVVAAHPPFAQRPAGRSAPARQRVPQAPSVRPLLRVAQAAANDPPSPAARNGRRRRVGRA
jgi:DNA-binding transcriptional LysR family regulator